MVRWLVIALLVLEAGSTSAASIFDGDPIDPSSGRPYAILPGVPLVLPQLDGKFDPPIVVPAVIGDVDLVVRAGHLGIGLLIPPPATSPPLAVAGGVHLVPGSLVPFTVLATDGGSAGGAPLGGSSLDGIPVVVVAFADLDGDGIIGPSAQDGTADNEREVQEAVFPVGRQVAVFSDGVAEGGVAVWKGAPASRGGLGVVLTAVAYVGPFRPTFFSGNVPDGPGVATLLPMFPRLDPRRVVDGEGRGGPADPDERLGVELEPAFPVPVNDPVLGTPFAIPLDGSSLTVDRARVVSGPVSRARFLRPAAVVGYSDESEAALYPAGGGELLEPQPAVALADDGPGGGVTVHLFPVDRLDNVTDPNGEGVTLLAGHGLAIVAPDTDGDPLREQGVLASAAGLAVTVDDAGGANDSGPSTTLTVVMNGVPVDVLPVTLTPGNGGPVIPVVRAVAIEGRPAVVRSCPVRRLVAAVVDPGSGGVPEVSAALSLNGSVFGQLDFAAIAPPPGLELPLGPTYGKRLTLQPMAPGLLEIVVTARSAVGSSAPATLALPVVQAMPPTVLAPGLDPERVSVGSRSRIAASARVIDDCRLRRVRVEIDTGKGYRRGGTLRDDGARGDAMAGDGVFTGTLRFRPRRPGPVAVRAVARNRAGLATTGPASILTVE